MDKLRRLLHSFTVLWSTLAMPPKPTRVGLLNTGELVLINDQDSAQVLSLPTTQTICQTLAASAIAMPAGPGPSDDPVHGLLRRALESQRSGVYPAGASAP